MLSNSKPPWAAVTPERVGDVAGANDWPVCGLVRVTIGSGTGAPVRSRTTPARRSSLGIRIGGAKATAPRATVTCTVVVSKSSGARAFVLRSRLSHGLDWEQLAVTV